MNVPKLTKEIRKKIQELENLKNRGQEEIEEIQPNGVVSKVFIKELLIKYQIMLNKAESEWEYEE